jgi:hypothetical protein
MVVALGHKRLVIPVVDSIIIGTAGDICMLHKWYHVNFMNVVNIFGTEEDLKPPDRR